LGDSPDPEALVQVAAIVAGAGATEMVQDLVKGFAPQIAPEIAGGAAGALLYYFGDRIHPLVKAFGVGLLAGSLSPMISRALRGGLAPAAAPAATATPAPTSGGGLAALAQAEAYAVAQSR